MSPFPETSLPELAEKGDLGIALSGGGTRSASLNERGILSKAKYVSSISGGSWTAGPLTYSAHSISIADYLGPSLNTSDCTIENLEAYASKGHALVISKANFMLLIAEKFGGNLPETLANGIVDAIGKPKWEKHDVDFWSAAVGEAFFDPHKIDSTSSSLPALPGAHANKVRASTLGCVANIYQSRPLNNFPFCIINGSVLEGGYRGCVPIEFTPLYYGVPLPRNVYKEGGLIEPHAFTGSLADVAAIPIPVGSSGTATVSVVSPPYVLSVPEMSGISSSALAQSKGDSISTLTYKLANFPVFRSALAGARKKYVDGGCTDFTGSLALVRRKCKTIVAALASNLSCDDPTVNDANAHTMGTLAGLFGAMQSSSKVDEVDSQSYNDQRKVFETEEWEKLIAALRARTRAGEPLVYRADLSVLQNKSIGVEGGYSCTLIIFISGECGKFTAALPEEVRQKIKDDTEAQTKQKENFMQAGTEDSNLANFPYIPVGRLRYGKLLTALMAQLGAWQVAESEKLGVLAGI